jgi:hypothetical protein
MSQKLPAGKYYLGDPCYVIDDTLWDEFLGLFWEQKPRGGIFTFCGYECCAFYTRYGDGQYELEPYGGWLPVDAGMIGAIPIDLCTRSSGHQNGERVVFDVPVECEERDGRLCFGEFYVETGDAGDGPDYCQECGAHI